MNAIDFDDWVAPHLAVLKAIAIRQVGRDDADDVVQDTLVRAWRRRSTYKPDRGSLRAWLVGVLLDQIRRRRRRESRADATESVEWSAAATDVSLGARLDVERAVRQLPRRQREVITLFYLADLPVDEVALLLGIRSGSVKSHLSDARTALRKLLQPTTLEKR